MSKVAGRNGEGAGKEMLERVLGYLRQSGCQVLDQVLGQVLGLSPHSVAFHLPGGAEAAGHSQQATARGERDPGSHQMMPWCSGNAP